MPSPTCSTSCPTLRSSYARVTSTAAVTQNDVPELATTAEHLLAVLGPDQYTALRERGEAMAPADAVRYALEQIELARGVL